ncbi:MAG: hypothetical protein PHQ90_08025 [Sulfuricurvum sp.]|nr:hypothetical protein [Sulfuricurvum sp.]
MRGLLFFVFVMIFANSVLATTIQWKALPLKSVDSKATPYLGELKKAYSYSDINGDHLLLVSQKDAPSPQSPSSGRNENFALRAVSFKQSDQGWSVEWSVKDGIDCPNLDSGAGFFYDQIAIEDLNNDHVAEVYLPYTYYCGGTDSSDVKVIMRTGELKFAVRGMADFVDELDNISAGENTKFDKSLDDPRYKVFKKKITEIWKKIVSFK